MTSRQRGATWFLALILLGRLLDALDLPFERFADEPAPRVALDADTLAVSPSAGAPESSPQDSTSRTVIPDTPTASEPLAINEASARELQTLPRVGPVLASRIVAWRDANGPFHSMGDLQRVQGIGARTAAQLAPLVRFH